MAWLPEESVGRLGERQIKAEDESHQNSQRDENHRRIVDRLDSGRPCYLAQLDIDLVEELTGRGAAVGHPRQGPGRPPLGRLGRLGSGDTVPGALGGLTPA